MIAKILVGVSLIGGNSGFEAYLRNIQAENLETAPSIEEARQDFEAVELRNAAARTL